MVDVTADTPRSLVGAPMPTTDGPTESDPGFQRGLTAFETPLDEPIKRLMKQQTETEKAKVQQQSNIDIAKEKAEQKAYQSEASQLRGQLGGYDKLMAERPKMNITPDTQQGLNGLAVLMPIAAMLIGAKGQMSGLNAMDAMTGMLKGYQEGNKQRIDFEKQKYDTAMREWENNYKVFQDKLAQSAKIFATDRQAGIQAARVAALEANSKVALAMLDKAGGNPGPLLDSMIRSAEQVRTAKLKAEQGLSQASVMTDDAAIMRAEMVLAGDYRASQNLGTGATGSQNRAKLDAEVARLAAERGISGADIARMRQTYMAETGAMKSLATTEAKVGAIINVMNSAIPAALEESEKLPRGSIVPVNKLIQKGQIATSDPRYYRFAVANLQLAENWARAMNPTGVMRVDDRELALDKLSTATSPETYKEIVMQLKKQVERERAAMKQTREEVGGRSESSSAAAPSFEGFRVSPVQE